MKQSRPFLVGILIACTAFPPWLFYSNAKAEPLVTGIVSTPTPPADDDVEAAEAIVSANTDAQAYLFGVDAPDADFLYLDSEPSSEGNYSGYTAAGTFTLKVAATVHLDVPTQGLSATQLAFVNDHDASTNVVVGSLEANGLKLWVSAIASTSNFLGDRATMLLLVTSEALVDGTLYSASRPVSGGEPPPEPGPGFSALCDAARQACRDAYSDNAAACKGALVLTLAAGLVICSIAIGASMWYCACCGIGCIALKVSLQWCARGLVAALATFAICMGAAAAAKHNCMKRANASSACVGIDEAWE